MPATRPHWVTRLDELHLLTPLRIIVILLVAIIATLVVRGLVTRMLRRTIELPGADRNRAEARQQALATALRSALIGVVWTAAVITVISEAGVNIGAFVATATVVGGAVAFGAQTLVRDVISGFFVLAEDQYGVGDRVDLGHAVGTVDRITLRTVRLRDGEGVVWYVPHGGVVRVANLSKAGALLLDVEVGRAMPVSAAQAAVGSLAAQLHDGARVVGLTAVRDDRLVFRVSAPVAPHDRDAVASQWRLLVLQAYESGTLVAPAVPAAAGAATAAAPATPPKPATEA